MYVHMNGLSFFDNVVTWYRCRAEHICNKVVKNVSFHQDPILTNLSNDFWVFCDRVARWYIFKPKIPISVNFGRFWNGKNWYTYFMPIWSIFRPFDIFYAHLVNFPAIWYILCPFGIFFPVLVYFYPFWHFVSSTIWQPWSETWLEYSFSFQKDKIRPLGILFPLTTFFHQKYSMFSCLELFFIKNFIAI
jgi:hypothetical protein